MVAKLKSLQSEKKKNKRQTDLSVTQGVRTGKFQTDGFHRHLSQGTKGQGRETEVAGSGEERFFLDFTRQRGGLGQGRQGSLCVFWLETCLFEHGWECVSFKKVNFILFRDETAGYLPVF